MSETVVIIPAYNPPDTLPAYVQELIAAGFDRIVIVDDGSLEKFQVPFRALAGNSHVYLIRHAVNLGKGRSLKDAFACVLTRFPQAQYVITADADGQHTLGDVLQICRALQENESRLILGTRDFHGRQVPFRSRAGNRITSAVFRLLYGPNLADTQTGLRGIPASFLPGYTALEGERYEYEMKMLLYETASGRPEPRQVPIRTVYLQKNADSHFRAVADSVRIYRLLLGPFFRFALSGLAASALDLGLFRLFLLSFPERGRSLGLATLCARAGSSLFNFLLNRKAVFQAGERDQRGQFFRYCALCGLQTLLSAAGVTVLHGLAGAAPLPGKVLVDGLLFLFSYRAQKRWVFAHSSGPAQNRQSENIPGRKLRPGEERRQKALP